MSIITNMHACWINIETMMSFEAIWIWKKPKTIFIDHERKHFGLLVFEKKNDEKNCIYMRYAVEYRLVGVGSFGNWWEKKTTPDRYLFVPFHTHKIIVWHVTFLD